MGHPDGAHTHGHGGGGGAGIGTAVLVLFAAALAVKLAAPVAAALGELLRVALIAVAVLAGLAVAGLVALAAARAYRWRASGTTRVSLPAPPPWRAVKAGAEPRPAIEQHVHFHGLSPEDVAAILAARQPAGPAPRPPGTGTEGHQP